MTEAVMGYRYRCGRCKTTSPDVLTRSMVEEERRKHRTQFHGGHVPDGEVIMAPEPFRFSDTPLRHWLTGGGVALFLIICIIVRHT